MPRRGPKQFGKTKSHFFQSLNLDDVITPEEPGSDKFTATKLIGSMGPSTHDADTLEAMIRGGMAAARLDLTWGPLDFHIQSLESLNVAMMRSKKLCAVLVDTLGREIMIKRPCTIGSDGWPLHAEAFKVTAGGQLMLTTRDVPASSMVLPVTYPQLHEMVAPGDNIYIGRYLVCGADSASLYLEVLDVQGQDILCEAKNDAEMDGALTVFHMERSSDALLNLQNTLPLLSDYDKRALAALGAQFEIDFICLSYTRTREDVVEARAFLDSVGMTATKVLAKLQTRQALLNFRGILAEADGIVLSRGNLGLDVPPEKMAIVQKQLITSCNFLGKPVIITRVLDSMVNNPRPTRAEATDIANLVLDGADAIQSGAETLRGNYPVEVMATLGLICRTAERVFDWQSHYDHLMDSAVEVEASIHEALRRRISKEMAAAAAASGIPNGYLHGGSGSMSQLGPKGVAFANDTNFGGSMRDLNGHGSTNGLQGESDIETDSVCETAGTSPVGSFGDMSLLGATAAAMTAAASYGNLAGSTFLGHGGTHGLSRLRRSTHSNPGAGTHLEERSPHLLQKLESLASAAVRAASMIGADLIVVYTSTGGTARLVAKYRPPMPILTLVVPRLVSDALHWKLEGRATARACQLTRGLLPMLATPGPNGDAVLEGAVLRAASGGLVRPRGHVVVLQQIGEDYALKVLSLDANGTRISRGSRAAELRNLAMRTLSHFSTGTRGTLRPLEGGAASSYMDGEEDDDSCDEGGYMDTPDLLRVSSLGLAPSITSPAEYELAMLSALREALEEQGKGGVTSGLDVQRLVKSLTSKALGGGLASPGSSGGAFAAMAPSPKTPPPAVAGGPPKKK